jgi:hypothetical protein
MSNETEQEKELKELEQQIEQAAEAKETPAAPVEPEPSPEPETSPAPEAQTEPQAPVAPSPAQKTEDNPLEWARKKGFKSDEDMARALLQKEREYHEARQKKEQEQQNTPPPPPAWTPQPQAPAYGYPPAGYGYPPPPPPPDLRRLAQQFDMDPDDFEKIARVNAALTQAALRQERARWESDMSGIRRQTERSTELMQLMQDPRFRHETVQREIHAVLDADPTIYQRERNPHAYAFKEALANLGSKQLQQGTTNGNTPPTNMPPVTAGGGNGSAYSGPVRISEKEFSRWPLKDQEAFINSNGRIVPKR